MKSVLEVHSREVLGGKQDEGQQKEGQKNLENYGWLLMG